MGNILTEMKFGKIEPGYVRLGMNGQMAIKIGNDYKYYDAKKKRLVNCDNFVFDLGSEFFFVMPTNKVKKGDIIIASGKPVYVIEPESEDGEIKVLSYEDASIKYILPERHTFLGNSYMYSKIVSLFGKKAFDKNTIMKYMMLNTLMGGNKSGSGLFGGTAAGGMNPMMLMMMMGGNNPFTSMFDFNGEGDIFDDLFKANDDEEVEDKAEEEDEEDEGEKVVDTTKKKSKRK